MSQDIVALLVCGAIGVVFIWLGMQPIFRLVEMVVEDIRAWRVRRMALYFEPRSRKALPTATSAGIIRRDDGGA